MKLSPVIVFVFLVVGLVSGFLAGSYMSIYSTMNVSVVRETTTIEFYVTLERTITLIESTTLTTFREKPVTVTVTSTITKPPKDLNLSCVVFRTSRDFYKTSESVTLILENRCDYTLRLPNSAPWMILNAYGENVFSPIALQVITEVGPGRIVTWTWNQRDNEGGQVSAGSYYARLLTMDAGMLMAEFKIIES